MCDDWDDNACVNYGPPQVPFYSTQVFTNSRDQNQWNNQGGWRDESRDFGGNQRGRNNYQNRGDRGDQNNRRPNNRGPRQNEDATIIKVPSRFVGRIIGRGGSKINDLQFESGAKINVTKETEGDETIVKLFGSGEAVIKAQELISELTVDRDGYSSQREPYGSQGARDNYGSQGDRPPRDNYGSQGDRPPRDNYSSQGDRPPRDNYGSQGDRPPRDNYGSQGDRPPRDNYGSQGDRPPRDNWSSQNGQSNSWAAPEPRPQEGQNDARPAIVDWQAFLEECDANEKAEWAKLPPIKKDFYEEHPDITALSEDEVAQFRSDSNNVVVERTFKTEGSKPIPKPVIRFEHAFFNYPEILDEIQKAGFTTPSPIQAQAWPVLLSGEDMIGIAQTGTGKTLAFLLPAMIHIHGQVTSRAERGGPAVLVMAPTRELALQIDKEVKKYEYKGITAVCVYGGGNRREQIKTLTEGVDIVIATPGRLNDLIEAGHLKVKYVTYVVLDEADRMLDMGFEPQIRKVMYSIRPTRQTVMTSATWPVGVRRLAQSYMEDPIQIYVGTLDLAATHTVTQVIEMVPDTDDDKLKVFLEFAFNLGPEEKAIVFCGKKSRADELASELILAGVNCQTMHGDREQCDREQALLDIADGTVKILIATDVASRGLDIDDITHVVNYDFPRNIEEYVHRVGRTGRAGKSGKSISYFTRSDWAQAKDLIAILEEAQQYVPEEIYHMAERHTAWKEKKDAERPQGGRGRFGGRGGGGGGGGGRRW